MTDLKRYTLYILNIVDIVSIFLAHILSFFLRTVVLNKYFVFVENADYREFLLLTLVIYVIYNVAVLYREDDVFDRSLLSELFAIVKMVLYILAFILIYLFAVKRGETFSRIYVFLFCGLLLLFDFILRIFVKKQMLRIFRSNGAQSLVLITTETEYESVLEEIRKKSDWRYSVKGMVLTDVNRKNEVINGIEVISDRKHMLEDLYVSDYDAILIASRRLSPETLSKWIEEFHKVGKPVHIKISEFDYSDSFKKVDRIGSLGVVSYRLTSPMPGRMVAFRRLLNTLLALILLPVVLAVTLLVGIFELFESRGPIFVQRVRVGKNNRRFFQYRFRIYRMDAAERKEKGLSPYTFIGKLLYLTHLDGLPLIFNVLFGDLFFVGPKAPNLRKYLTMTTEQRNNLMVSPGIVGYWCLTEDDEKDTEFEHRYIKNWNIGRSIGILVKVCLRYLTGRSLREHGETHMAEEYEYIAATNEEFEPLAYDRSNAPEHDGIGYLLYSGFKRLFDIVFSLTAIIILSPLFLILAVLIIMDDGGNPVYGQCRIGKEGRIIKIYKFRSMRTDAGNIEKLLDPEQLKQYRKEFKVEHDPRITKLGDILRRTSLDELPQLFNVLGGSLSLIGPRPVVKEEIEKYGDDIAKFLSVSPGLTGYWQAFARNNATYDTGERQRMELYYVDHQSLWLDIKIFFKTFVSVAKQEGAG